MLRNKLILNRLDLKLDMDTQLFLSGSCPELVEKILIVEDDAGLRELVRHSLTETGFKVMTAADGAEAVKTVASESGVLLLLDYQLPDMNGRELIENLAREGYDPPFIIMTGRGDEQLAVEMMKLGAQDYLIKNSDFFDLLPEIIDRTWRNLEMEWQLEQSRIELGIYEQRYRRLAENTPVVVFQFKRSPSGQYSFPYLSPNVVNLREMAVTEIQQDLDKFLAGIHPEDQPVFYQGIEESASNLTPYYQVLRFFKRDRIHWLEISSTPKKTNDGSIIWDGFFHDISTRIKSAERLEKINNCLSSLTSDYQENINSLVKLFGQLLEADCSLYNKIDGGLLRGIGQWRAPQGFELRDNPEGHICYDVIQKPTQEPFLVRNAMNSKYVKTDPGVMEFGLQTYLGHPVWGLDGNIGVICALFKTDYEPTSDDFRVLSLVAVALSREEERMTAELKLTRQLQEKEILMREIHHRIKNNIASIQGILFLQTHASQSPEVQEALQDVKARVESMGQLYEKMLISGEYQDLDAAVYLGELADSIPELFDYSGNISIIKNIMPRTLNSRILFPLGIILNELITNSIKYAFADHKTGEADKAGEIKIELRTDEKNGELIVSDNGRGLPAEFELGSVDCEGSFGLMLVKMLTEQLEGEFEINSCNGTVARIKFKK